jgi:hypothetical protein
MHAFLSVNQLLKKKYFDHTNRTIGGGTTCLLAAIESIREVTFLLVLEN